LWGQRVIRQAARARRQLDRNLGAVVMNGFRHLAEVPDRQFRIHAGKGRFQRIRIDVLLRLYVSGDHEAHPTLGPFPKILRVPVGIPVFKAFGIFAVQGGKDDAVLQHKRADTPRFEKFCILFAH
jgi:hypothetical protein